MTYSANLHTSIKRGDFLPKNKMSRNVNTLMIVIIVKRLGMKSNFCGLYSDFY